MSLRNAVRSLFARRPLSKKWAHTLPLRMEVLEERATPASFQLVSNNARFTQENAVSADGRFALLNPTVQQNEDTPPFPHLYDRVTDTLGLALLGVPPLVDAAASLNLTVFTSSQSILPQAHGISDDGNVILFTLPARQRIGGVLGDEISTLLAFDRAANRIDPVAVVNGVVIDTFGGPKAMSADGRFVAYAAGPSFQLVVFDRQTRTATQVTNGNSEVTELAVSRDGGVVLFRSQATNLTGQADTNNGDDLFVFRRATGQVQLVTKDRGNSRTADVAFGTNPAAGNASLDGIAALSRDGSTVAFVSAASDHLNTPDGNLGEDVYLYDVASGLLELVTTTFGTQTPAVRSGPPGFTNPFASRLALSDDGNVLTFFSNAENMHAPAGTINGTLTNFSASTPYIYDGTVRLPAHGFRTDVVNSQQQLVEDERIGIAGDPVAALSADGRFVYFLTSTNEPIAGINQTTGFRPRIIRANVATGFLENVTTNDLRPGGTGIPNLPTLIHPSDDGRFAYYNLDFAAFSTEDAVFLRDQSAAAERQIAPDVPSPALPDLLVKRREQTEQQFIGLNEFEPDVIDQRAGSLSSNGEPVIFDIRLRNAGDVEGTFDLAAENAAHDDINFRYEYRRNGQDVTAAVRGGTISVTLGGGEFADFEMIVTPLNSAEFGAVDAVPIFTSLDFTPIDEVSVETRFGLVVNTDKDRDDENLYDDGILDVDPTEAGTQISLRAAIRLANATAESGEIRFAIPGGGIPRIDVGFFADGALPAITDPVTIDATTQPGGRVEIRGAGAGLASGFTLDTLESTIRGFVITGFESNGVNVLGDDNTIEGNIIGTDFSTTETTLFNHGFGILVAATADGTRIDSNVVSANLRSGVLNAGSNTTIVDNRIGTTRFGDGDLGNREDGVELLNAAGAVVRGNVISGNARAGVRLTEAGTTGAVIRANTIGMNEAQTATLPNDGDGIVVDRVGAGNVIGGNTAADGNVIAGNAGAGVRITDTAQSVGVFHNRIGLSPAPQTQFGNAGGGVAIENAANHLIGGAGKGNDIVANGAVVNDVPSGDGVRITGTASQRNTVAGNNIGGGRPSVNGNKAAGVRVEAGASFNTIGGSGTGEGNDIANSGLDGVFVTGGANDNTVAGNFIGTNSAGFTNVFNLRNGVRIEASSRNVIGGPTGTAGTGAGNVISGNARFGIEVLAGTGAAEANRVEGNLIGLDPLDDSRPLPNGLAAGVGELTGGVLVAATDTVIGGGSNGGTPGAGFRTPEGNVIAGNKAANVVVAGAQFTKVQGNIIGLNRQRVRPEDLGDATFQNGIVVTGSAGTLIGTDDGGTAVAGAGNLIGEHRRVAGVGDAATGAGVRVTGVDTVNTRIFGNFFGTDPENPTTPRGNAVGVRIDGNAQQTTVGTTVDLGDDFLDLGNVFRHNSDAVTVTDVLSLTPGRGAVVIQSNRFGVGEGELALDLQGGIDVRNSQDVRIGPRAEDFVLDENLLLTNTFRRMADAVTVTSEAGGVSRNVSIVGNLISNTSGGVALFGAGTERVQVIGNRFFDTLGDTAVLISDASRNVIDGNGFTRSAGVGVRVEQSVPDDVLLARFNSIRRNTFVGTQDLAIDLVGTNDPQPSGGGDLVFPITPNDAFDGDAGPNALQNTITRFSATAQQDGRRQLTLVMFDFNSIPRGEYTVEFYRTPGSGPHPSGTGEAAEFIDDVRIVADDTGGRTRPGNLPDFAFPLAYDGGGTITALVSRIVRTPEGDVFFETSEFSPNAVVRFTDFDRDGIPDVVEDLDRAPIPEANGQPPGELAAIANVLVEPAQPGVEIDPANQIGLAVGGAGRFLGARAEDGRVNLRGAEFAALIIDYQLADVPPGVTIEVSVQPTFDVLGDLMFMKLDAAGNPVFGPDGEPVLFPPDAVRQERLGNGPIRYFVTITDNTGDNATTTGRFDLDPTPGVISDPIAIVAVPTNDLTVSTTTLTAEPRATSPLAYQVDVQNAGATAAPVRLTHTLPAGVTLVSANAGQGTVTRTGDVLTVEFGAVPAGGTASLVVTLTAPQPGDLTATSVAAFGDALRIEANPADNTSQVTVTVGEAPPAPPAPPAGPGTVIAVGGAGTVTLFAPTGAAVRSITPFPGFTGSVRTVSADFTGDGVEDLAVGTGPGTAARVKVLDGVTGATLLDVDPFGDAFNGGTFVAAGDLDGDGRAELVVTPDVTGGPRVVVLRGGTFAQAASFLGIEDDNFRGGVRAAIGDVNGDGVADLVVAAGFGGGPRVAVFDGRGLLVARTKLMNDFFVFDQGLRDGAFVGAGDVNGDGFDDLVAGAGNGGAPRVLVLSGAELIAGRERALASFFAGDAGSRAGVRLVVKDLNGDDRADLVTGDGADDRVITFFGPDFTTTDSFDAFPGATGGVFVG